MAEVLTSSALARASAADAERLRAALGNGDLEPAEIEAATRIIRDTGAEEHVISMVESRHREAADVLEGLDLEPDGKSFLAGLVDYLRERNL